jgi:formate hydrogenlyase subunit 3/multisubunit Na+/H+ antiporter MnhD subunit
MASLVAVVVARDAVLFLLAWEIMSVSSFFLVTFHDEKENVRQAGWTYLVATHFGTAFLLIFFISIALRTGSFDFDTFRSASVFLPGLKGILFLLALVGFGTKAGFIPFHVWLPEAHPAAPSHVSALMSGVMIKMGIYGLLRTLIWLGSPALWWGWVLVGVGLLSGVLGVLYAFSQKELKRLLAYSSVENIGIIALGMGIGVIGWSSGMETVAVLGFAGALFHVANHAIFKSLLFLCAGSVLHETGTDRLDALGGLFKKMRWTGTAFLIGACAISGLPPLNGFISEFFIYLASFQAVASTRSAATGAILGVIGGLALIGALVAATFAKAFGIIFLGERRVADVPEVHESGRRMVVPMLILALACFAAGLFSVAILRAMVPVLQTVMPLSRSVIWANLTTMKELLVNITVGFLGLTAAGIVLFLVRLRLLAGRNVRKALTWDCGFARPTPRMQYSAGSFSEIFTSLACFLIKVRFKFLPPEGFFPRRAALSVESGDAFRESLYRPIFRRIGRRLARLRWIQSGRTQVYVLYIAVTLLALFIWRLR